MYFSKSRNVFWPNWAALECQQKLFPSCSMVCQQGLWREDKLFSSCKHGYSLQKWKLNSANCICLNSKLYLSKLMNVFVKIYKYIFSYVYGGYRGWVNFTPVANMVTDFKKGSQNGSTRFPVDCLLEAPKFLNCPNFERYFINFANKYRWFWNWAKNRNNNENIWTENEWRNE